VSDSLVLDGAAEAQTVADLARLLRQLRRREARREGATQLTYRELAAKTGWSRGAIGEYFGGNILPPTDRFDVLIRLLGATPAEQGVLATARDLVEERRRGGAALAGAEPTLYRRLSSRAIAVGAIRLAAGELAIDRRGSIPETRAERYLDEIDDPEHPAGEREHHLVRRLLAATTDPAPGWVSDAGVVRAVVGQGLGWLLEGGGDASAVLEPRELLTARYATGAAAAAWRDRAEPMPIRDAVEAALADPDLDGPAALATVTLLRELRAEQERAEAAATC
jgi:Helix-turn-helix domain